MDEVILSKDNERVKVWRTLLTNKGRKKEEKFLLESKRGIEEGLLKGFEPEVLIIREGLEVPDAFKRIATIVFLGQSAYKSLTETENSQGFIGVYPIQPLNMRLLDQGQHLFYLDGIQDPGNLGTLIRSGGAFNIDGLLLGEGTVDPYNSKVLRSTMGGIFAFPIFEVTLETVAVLKEKGFEIIASTFDGTPLEAWESTKPFVLGIGNENKGLSEGFIALADAKVTIPMVGLESLNAGVAGSIFMYKTYDPIKL